MKPYNYQAVWSDYSEWILQKNDVQNFNGQLNFTIIETHENEKGWKKSWKSLIYFWLNSFNKSYLLAAFASMKTVSTWICR